MDKLLDKEVHQLYKASPHDCDISNYFGSNSVSAKNAPDDGYNGDDGMVNGNGGADGQDANSKSEASSSTRQSKGGGM